MSRYGQQFGPDFTFLGVPMCDLDDPSTYADAQVVILGAPFDGGTSARSGRAVRADGDPDARLPRRTTARGPASRCAPTGWSTSHVVDAGDVEMYSGDIETALPALEAAVEKVTRSGAIPVDPRRRPLGRPSPTRRASRTCSATAGSR